MVMTCFSRRTATALRMRPFQQVIDAFKECKKTAMFLSVRPEFNAHLVTSGSDGTVLSVEDMSRSQIRINGGFFVFKREILDLIEPGDELVEETFAKLIARNELVAYPYDGFFGPMDTIKDRQRLEALHESGHAPWLGVDLARHAESPPD